MKTYRDRYTHLDGPKVKRQEQNAQHEDKHITRKQHAAKQVEKQRHALFDEHQYTTARDGQWGGHSARQRACSHAIP